ncbi:YvrJ family protein, partial [Clostridium neonatale]
MLIFNHNIYVLIKNVNDLIGLIGNVGFPVAISAYLLIRLE